MTIPTPNPDYSCDKCGETYVLTGETDADMIRAVAEWPGCCVGERPRSYADEALRSDGA